MSAPASPDTVPLVTVIVTVHDVAAHVGEAVASVKAQTLADFEVLVIDDGSTDGSGDIAMAAVDGDARFRLIRQKNAGLSAARNRGLDLARGAFVAFLDGDDAFAPRFLEDLHTAILRDSTDWAACAITLVFPGGWQVTHSAVHGAPDPGPARVIAMTDACTVARQFPSAWNKLYRRSFLAGLRYPEDSWFEDHEVFWALAAQGRPLSYCPVPLYRHRRDRPGQITGADSDRAFDQFAVLDRLRPVIRDSGLERADAGFAQLATRLIHERALVLRQRDRRRRFLSRARGSLERHGCVFDPASDSEISHGLGLALSGETPLSVVVLDGPDVQTALDSLTIQGMADFDVTLVAAPGCTRPDALACGEPVRRIAPDGLSWAGLAAGLRGRSVVILNAGERMMPDGLLRLVNLIEATGAPLAFAGIERARRGYHDGWTDNTLVAAELAGQNPAAGRVALTPERALRLHPVLGNRILRRDLLAGIDAPVSGALPAVQAFVLETALAAGEAGLAAHPVLRAPDVPGPVPPSRRLPALLQTMLPHGTADTLPKGWQRVLFLRFERFRIEALGHHPRRFWASVLVRLRTAEWRAMSGPATPDPETPRWVARAIRRIGRRGRRDVASR